MLFGGIEAGGTKMVCAVCKQDGTIVDRISIPTETPELTLPRLVEYFRKWELAALGIGCFGPIDLNRTSKTYGYITKTPKAGWADCEIVGYFERKLGIPVGFDTDVNAAVLGEVVWGAAKDCESAIYITIGTGIGVGVYVNGGLLHGLVHPEAGHILLAKRAQDPYEGGCPFHKNCFEGLASGPAIEKRWGQKAAELFDREEVWELESDYIAEAVANYVMTYSPQKIVLWGGVMHQEQLFGLVRSKVVQRLGGYVQNEMLLSHIDTYIVPPGLGENPGILGSVYLGIQAWNAEADL